MFSHAISCQGGVTRAEGEGKERGVSGWGGVSWRASWFAGFVVTMPVTKAEGGVEGPRRWVLSGLDVCKINILWTLPSH